MTSKTSDPADVLRREAELFEKHKDQKKLAGGYRAIPRAQDPSQVYSVRIPVEQLSKLKKMAKARGLQPSAMMRAWVLERLNIEGEEPGDVATIAQELFDAASRLRAVTKTANDS
ncbi:MAG: hypothetical protein ACR2FO_00455 [Actinomycetota bacterium]